MLSRSDNKIAPRVEPNVVTSVVWRNGRRWRERKSCGAGGLQQAVRTACKAYKKTGRMLDAALAYAEHGVPVFPCSIRTKVPIASRLVSTVGKKIDGTGGFKRATTDPEQIREWWGDGRLKYLIGMPTGRPTGVWILDVDTGEEHAVDGVPVWERLQAEHGRPVSTRRHITSSLGLHEIFDWTEANPIGLTTGELPAGMEVKALGGYIITPPSKRKGKPYTVARDIAPKPAPAWLYDLIGESRGIIPRKNNSKTKDRDPDEEDDASRPDTVWHGDSDPTADPDVLADALSYVVNDGDWMSWTSYGLAIYAAIEDKERAGNIFVAFSKRATKNADGTERYNEATTRARWREICGSPPNRTGAWKIFNAATAAGWKAKPSYAAPEFDEIGAARTQVENLVRRFLGMLPTNVNAFQQYASSNPGNGVNVVGARVTTGVGKTSIAAKVVAERLAQSKEHGVLSVPTHRLGKEIEKLFIDHGVDVRVFRGREAEDPESPGETMCLDLDKVKEAQNAKQDVSKTCCKYKKDVCPFFSQCGYQRQKQGKRPRMWIIAHDLLFRDQPALGNPNFLLIDEGFCEKQQRSMEELPLKALDADLARGDLAAIFQMQKDDGPLHRGSVDGVTDVHEQSAGIIWEWAHMPKPVLRPSMNKTQYIAACRKVLKQIKLARQVITVREELRRMLDDPAITESGRLFLAQSDRLRQRVVTWSGIEEITKRLKIKTLVLDATLPPLELLRISHPQIQIVADIAVAMPDSVRIRQWLNMPTSASKLGNKKHLEELQRFVMQRWYETGRGKTLVITQMKGANWFRKKLPPEIDVAHYNAISGLDQYKDVRLIILLGCTQPGPLAVEGQAATLSGQMPPSINNGSNGQGFSWYKRVKRGIRVKGSAKGRAVMGDQHPDPLCEAIRWQITEGELMQALGRARGVNRTKQSPLDIDLCFNTVLPIEVDEIRSREKPSLYLTTAIDDGVMLESPSDMTKVWPDLWPSGKKGDHKAADRTVKGGLPKLPGFTPVTYQLQGAEDEATDRSFRLDPYPGVTGLAGRKTGRLAELLVVTRRRPKTPLRKMSLCSASGDANTGTNSLLDIPKENVPVFASSPPPAPSNRPSAPTACKARPKASNKSLKANTGKKRRRKPPIAERKEKTPQQKRDAEKRLTEYRERQEEAKLLAKEKKRPKVDGKIDKQRYYPVLLWDSEVVKITTLVDEAGDDSDQILLGFPWKRWVGEQAGKIVCNALRVSRPRRG